MKINESATDRVVRVIAGLVLLSAWVFGWMTGVWEAVFAVVGAVLLLTGVVGFCPIYGLFGACTVPRKRA
jgi:hypothetical protein